MGLCRSLCCRPCHLLSHGLLQDNSDDVVLRSLLNTFKANLESTPTLAWQYFGTQRGMHGIFPAAPRSKCNNYDPRVRTA